MFCFYCCVSVKQLWVVFFCPLFSFFDYNYSKRHHFSKLSKNVYSFNSFNFEMKWTLFRKYFVPKEKSRALFTFSKNQRRSPQCQLIWCKCVCVWVFVSIWANTFFRIVLHCLFFILFCFLFSKNRKKNRFWVWLFVLL